MKQVCLQCWREAPVGSLWCQERDCAPDDKPVIFEPGESLAEMSVVKVLAVLPAATIYEVERESEKALLKVAYQGFEERLRREVKFLLALQRTKHQHPAFPALLPAYAQADLSTHPYGTTVLNGQAYHYAVFVHLEGETLRDVLLKEPQPWYRHAVWLTLELADAIHLMHQNGRLHLCLSPEMVLIRRDSDDVLRAVLLDLGVVTSPEETGNRWQDRFAFPAYIAPELLQQSGAAVGAFSDVYGLGLILHEMLAGQPAYPYRLRSRLEIVHDVLNAAPAALNRFELGQIPQIVVQATSQDYRRRHPDVLSLARELQTTVPSVPRERIKRYLDWRVLAIVLAGILTVVLLLVVAASQVW